MFLPRCHKRLITFIIVVLFFSYVLWLVELKLFKYTHYEVVKRNAKINEDNLSNDGKNRRDRVLSLSANTLNSFDLLKKDYLEVNDDSNDKSNVDFEDIMKFLYKNQAFLVDIDLLKKLLFLTESSKIDNNNNKKFNFIYKSLNDYAKFDEKAFLYFGIYAENFFQIQNLDLEYNLNCEISQQNGTNQNFVVVTNVYFLCKNINFQLTIFYQRGGFLWTGSANNVDVVNTKMWFGDVPRAINMFALDKIRGFSYGLFIPKNLRKFLFDYKTSKFLECNRSLAEYNLKLLGYSYEQNLAKNEMILPVIKHMSDTLENFEKHYWLAGGTLLGWYRDCGIIPHTQDIDFGIWSHEYETKIKKAFLGNKIVRVWGTLGLVNDSYEFRMFNDQFTFDMFLVYKINETHQWCGYQVNRSKFRRWLPNFNELCSAELLNNKFMIPCDPVGYLNKEYGNEKNWITPRATNYTWSNVVYKEAWSDSEWPHVVKYYDKEGDLIKPKILNYLNKYSKIAITDVYDEDI